MTIGPMAPVGSALPTLNAMPLKNNPKEFSLYFHLPFCRRKCPYCHFYVVPNKQELHKPLMEALKRGFLSDLKKMEGQKLRSIYFGGGTPALVAPALFKDLLTTIQNHFSLDGVEITVEANPEDLTKALAFGFREAGINRLSIGVQTLDPTLLRTIGRRHLPSDSERAVRESKEAGFDNISVDLMIDLPDEKKEAVLTSLDPLLSLPITHLSLYNLTFEEGAAFKRMEKKLTKRTPTPEESLEILNHVIEKIESFGLSRYEISAFAKTPEFESVHNKGYWQGRPFLGYGPSAYSDWDGARFCRPPSLELYLEDPNAIEFYEKLAPKAAFYERLAVALRLFEGVDFGLDDPKIKALIEDGILSYGGKGVRLTPKGRLLYEELGIFLVEV